MKKMMIVILTVLWMLLCMIPASGEGNTGVPGGLVGDWHGTGTPKNGGPAIDLSAHIEADGSGEYTFIQDDYTESYPFTISGTDSAFVVDIPADNTLGIARCEGTWALEDNLLKLDITTSFMSGGSYSYTAECEKAPEEKAAPVSILPVLSEPEPEEVVPETVIMPSLEQVSWYDCASIKKADEGRLVYHYYDVSEAAYQSLGVAMAEAGYVLKDSATEENGDLRFAVGNETVDMEIIYHGVGGDMDIYYPENAVLAPRDEEALTAHLAFGETFLTTSECSYALECVKAMDSMNRIYTSGYPIVFRYDKTRKSDETTQYVVIGYSCTSHVAYETEPRRYYGETLYDREDFSFASDGKGWSNAEFYQNNELASDVLPGGGVRYYVQVIYYDPTKYQGEIPISVSFISEDHLMKYVYDAVVGE